MELNENIGNVKAVLTVDDLQALKGGSITNQQGTTKYNQYLRLDDTVVDSGKVVWDQNGANDVGDFLKFVSGNTMFEYELEFEEGLDSTISSTYRLTDLENRDFNILGKTLTLTRAETTSAKRALTLTFLGGEWSDTMSEGQKETVTIGDKSFDIEVVIITTGTTPTVKLKINGELTDKLEEGETTILSDGTTIGVREILLQTSAKEGTPNSMVEFYIGAEKIVLYDDNILPTGTGYNTAGATKVNDDSVTNGEVQIKGSMSGSDATINDIKYRLRAEPLSSEDNVLIPSGAGLRANLKAKTALGMLHDNWDIVYKGLAPEATNVFKIDASSDNKYLLNFVNVNGDEYSGVPIIDNSGGNFIVGKDATTPKNLWWVEHATGVAAAWIVKNDWFITSSKDDTNGITHVLKLDSIDTSSKKVEFTDLATGTIQATYANSTTGMQGVLILSGKSYVMYVNESASKIGVDLDGDGTLNAGEKAVIVVKGGGEVYLGYNLANEAAVTAGKKMLIKLVTASKLFDETPGNENIYFNATNSGTDQVDVSMVNSTAICSMKTLDNIDDQKQQCMTKYGVLVEKYDPTGTTTAAEMTITYPEAERNPLVFVESGKTSTKTSGGGSIETETVVPIPSTASVLDSEVTNAKSQNLIIVGGPCANTVAQAVTGVAGTWPECAAGVEAGKAIIKLLDSTDGMAAGKVAMLVYGFNAKDTRLAAQVVANYGDYATKFTGKELEVTGTSLTDVVIGAPVVK